MRQKNWHNYEDEVRAFSKIQEEPTWMLQKRLEALQALASENLSLPNIDRVKLSRFKLFEVGHFGTSVWEDALLSADVPDFLALGDHPAIVQRGTTTILEQIPTELLEQGVLVLDLFTALKEYPELIEKIYMTKVIPAQRDQLTAFHAAFMNSGIFIYVPKHVEIKEPIESWFLVPSNEEKVVSKHVLLFADEGSKVTYLEHVVSEDLGSTEFKISGNMMVEVIAQAGAHVHYAAVDQWGKSLSTYIYRRGYVGRDARIDWAIGMMNEGDAVHVCTTDLVCEGGSSTTNMIGMSSGKQRQAMHTEVINHAPHTVGHIHQHGVILDQATLTFNAIGHILKGAKGADAQQESRLLMFSEGGRGDANPILLIDEHEVTAGHAASVGRVDPDEMYYLMSRGLSKEVAERLVIRGFLSSVLTEIPVDATRQQLVAVIEHKWEREA